MFVGVMLCGVDNGEPQLLQTRMSLIASRKTGGTRAHGYCYLRAKPLHHLDFPGDLAYHKLRHTC